MRSVIIASEHQEQAAVVSWFRQQYPRYTILAIPNGAHLAGDARARAIKMRKLKEAGLLVGCADLLVAVPTEAHAGLFVEMKRGDGSPTEEQERFGAAMLAAGYHWACCRGFVEAHAVITKYMKERFT